MREHHTKNKGDLAVLHAQVDLAEKGYRILLPLTEHEYFDLVAYKDSRFLRIQVKYRTAKDGVINVSFKSWWADRHGCHKLLMDKDKVDLVCVYARIPGAAITSTPAAIARLPACGSRRSRADSAGECRSQTTSSRFQTP